MKAKVQKTLSNRQRNLYTVRVLSRYKQKDLDEHTKDLGAPERTQKYESGIAEPPEDYLKRIAKLVGVRDWRNFDEDEILHAFIKDRVTYVPYWGQVPAGDWESPGPDGEECPVPEKAGNVGDVIAVKIVGESMLPLLHPGDIVPILLEKTGYTDGSVILVRNQDNELTIKVARYFGHWEFHSLNPKYNQVRAEKVEIVGKLIYAPEHFEPTGMKAV